MKNRLKMAATATKVYLSFLFLIGVSLIWITDAAAQRNPNTRITDDELEDIDEDIVRRIHELERRRENYQNWAEEIIAFTTNEKLPDVIERKLILRAARMEPRIGRKVELYESQLDDTQPQEDADIRGLILNHLQSSDDFGSYVDRLNKMDNLLAPLLEIPVEELKLQSIYTISHYGRLIYQFGSLAASRYGRFNTDEDDLHGIRTKAAKERLFYAEKSRDILTRMLREVDRRIDVRDPSEVRRPDQLGRVDDPLLNAQAGMQHNLRRATRAIENSQKRLTELEKAKQ